jgi:hypothetical protein
MSARVSLAVLLFSWTEARYRFDVVEEPPTNPPELDVYEEL